MKEKPKTITDILNKRSPKILTEYFFEFFSNKPDAGIRLHQEIINMDYDYIDKTGYYDILTPEQVKAHEHFHQLRKSDPQLDKNATNVALVGGLTYLIARAIDLGTD